MMPTTVEKKDIRQLSLEELIHMMESEGEKPFRAKQVYEWLWKKSAMTFDEMTNLSQGLRERLNQRFDIHPMRIKVVQKSNDGTLKVGLELYDGELIEGVLIPTEGRMTACISSQVGCSLSCKFCATGFLERKRNLSPAEIYDQVVMINNLAFKNHDKPLTNIVLMGMGEPLLNYGNVLKGIEHVTSPQGLGMSAKRITLSTAGVAKMIKKLGDDEVRFNLALSLHAADDKKRDSIMAINEQNNLEALVEALNYFYQHTHSKITFEYILFDKFNDSIEDAKNLVALCKKVPAMVNVIEYNPVEGVRFTRTDEQRRTQFIQYLGKHGVVAKVRLSRGKDIDAACGQLANKG